MTSKRIYMITGATGFIGSCLLRKLVARNEKVHLLVRKKAQAWRIRDMLRNTTVHFSDLSDESTLTKLVKKIKPDIIYHLATYGAYPFQDNAEVCIKTNIAGTLNLLKATSRIDYELFVNTGSSSEYGFKKLPIKETDSLEPVSYYAVSKCAQTLLCTYFAKERKKPIVTLRPFSVYGPYEDRNRFIPVLLKSLFFQKQMNLVSPDIARDWVYVDDMVNAYLLIRELRCYSGEVFNIGTGKQTTIKEVVGLAAKITGKTTHCIWGGMNNRKWDTPHWVADVTKTKKLLGWSPQFDLRLGLSATWTWFIKNHAYYRYYRKK